MSRAKLVFAACFAVFAFSGLVAAQAFAGGEWDVNGEPLHGTAALANAALVLKPGVLKIDNASPVEIECLAHEILINEGVLISPDGILAKSITFHECSVILGNPTCILGSSLITTVPIHGLAHLDEGGRLNTLILILPETKTTFATIKFEGENCALLGVQPVTGGVHLLIDEGYLPKELHLVLAVTLKGGLKVGSSEALLTGLDADIRLQSGALWRFL